MRKFAIGVAAVAVAVAVLFIFRKNPALPKQPTIKPASVSIAPSVSTAPIPARVCPECKGSGRLENYSEKITCTYCNYTGKVDCPNPNCLGGLVPCPTCLGVGQISVSQKINDNISVQTPISTCPTCGGIGRVICEICGGRGWIICPYCGGNLYFTVSRPQRCYVCGGTGFVR